MPDMTISYQTERLTALDSDGRTMGYVTFPRIRKGLVNIDQVQILPAYRSRNLEETLLDALFSHLLQQGTKAALTSPAVQRHAAANPKWKAILPDSIHMTTH